MKKVVWIAVGVVVVLVVLGIVFRNELFMGNGFENPYDIPPVSEEITEGNLFGAPDPSMPDESSESRNVIAYRNGAFSPASITVKKGDTVTFTNEDESAVWPASAMHPTHGVYPEQGGCIGSTFDACKELKKGESWSFQFNQVGTWKYHNHVNASAFGEIVVTE